MWHVDGRPASVKDTSGPMRLFIKDEDRRLPICEDQKEYVIKNDNNVEKLKQSQRIPMLINCYLLYVDDLVQDWQHQYPRC